MKQKQVDSVEHSPWIYKGDPIGENNPIPEWAVAIVYKITRSWCEGRSDYREMIYIGKKMLTSTSRKRIGVREKANTGTRKTFKSVTKESTWQNYWSSCKELQNDQKEHPKQFTRQILEYCYSKKNATYLELKMQFMYNVLERTTYNNNIHGSIYRQDATKEAWEEHKEKMKTVVRKPRVKKQIKY